MAREEAEIKELTKKLEQNPESMVFVQLADAYRRSGDLERCVEICQQGLERHPTYTTARTILGRAFLDLGKLDEAAGEFKKIEISDPENIVAQRMLGQIYMDKGLFAEAIAKHQKVLALDPDDTAAQEHLQEALTRAKQAPDAKPAPKPVAEAPRAAQPSAEQLGTIKVAEIYIKKGALDEAVEVLSEILAGDPQNALARQKLKEVEERRGAKSGAAASEQEAKKKADEEAKARAEEEAKRKAEDEAKKKAADEAKKKAEEEAKKKADDESKRKAEEEAKKKADEEARKKADEEAKHKAEEEAKKKAADEAKKKADDEAKRKADEEEAKKKADEDAKKKNKLSSDDILSVMKSDDDELIGDSPSHAGAPKEKAAAVPASAGLDPKLKEHVANFVKNNGIEASLVIGSDGKLLDSAMQPGADAAALAGTSSSIFSNTEKAAQRMRFGGLQQVIVTSDDGRQIIFVQLKAAVLVAVTGKNTNLGMLRIAINDLMKKA